jgi:hypothetical protein
MECIYVLELEQGKYYVGKSNCVQKRIQNHFSGNGSARWTRTFKPTGRYRIIDHGTNPYNLKVVTEATVTYHLMLKFGYQNVRGAGWTFYELKKLPEAPKEYATL